MQGPKSRATPIGDVHGYAAAQVPRATGRGPTHNEGSQVVLVLRVAVWYMHGGYPIYCIGVCRCVLSWVCLRGILPEWSKGADLRSARRQSAWVQTPQVPCYASHWCIMGACLSRPSLRLPVTTGLYASAIPPIPFLSTPRTPHSALPYHTT